jgi:hypothetical protein
VVVRRDAVVEHLLGADAAEPALVASMGVIAEVAAGDVVLERLASEVQPTEQARDHLGRILTDSCCLAHHHADCHLSCWSSI